MERGSIMASDRHLTLEMCSKVDLPVGSAALLRRPPCSNLLALGVSHFSREPNAYQKIQFGKFKLELWSHTHAAEWQTKWSIRFSSGEFCGHMSGAMNLEWCFIAVQLLPWTHDSDFVGFNVPNSNVAYMDSVLQWEACHVYPCHQEAYLAEIAAVLKKKSKCSADECLCLGECNVKSHF